MCTIEFVSFFFISICNLQTKVSMGDGIPPKMMQ